jgi:hypothetical protein
MAMIWIPFTCESATALIVEGPAHGRLWAELGTALIMPFILGIDVTVLGRPTQWASGPRTRKGRSHFGDFMFSLITTWPRMQRCHHLGGPVHTFNDVILAPPWPHMLRVLAKHPERWPGTTTGWHVVNANYKESSAVLSF